MPLWMPRALIAQGIKEVYGEPGRIKPGVVDRYYDLSRRPGNRKGMMEIFRVLLKVNREELGTSGERIARIVAPTLLMWGERDRWISPKHVPLWQRDLPGIQVKTLSGRRAYPHGGDSRADRGGCTALPDGLIPGRHGRSPRWSVAGFLMRGRKAEIPGRAGKRCKPLAARRGGEEGQAAFGSGSNWSRYCSMRCRLLCCQGWKSFL